MKKFIMVLICIFTLCFCSSCKEKEKTYADLVAEGIIVPMPETAGINLSDIDVNITNFFDIMDGWCKICFDVTNNSDVDIDTIKVQFKFFDRQGNVVNTHSVVFYDDIISKSTTSFDYSQSIENCNEKSYSSVSISIISAHS